MIIRFFLETHVTTLSYEIKIIDFFDDHIDERVNRF